MRTDTSYIYSIATKTPWAFSPDTIIAQHAVTKMLITVGVAIFQQETIQMVSQLVHVPVVEKVRLLLRRSSRIISHHIIVGVHVCLFEHRLQPFVSTGCIMSLGVVGITPASSLKCIPIYQVSGKNSGVGYGLCRTNHRSFAIACPLPLA